MRTAVRDAHASPAGPPTEPSRSGMGRPSRIGALALVAALALAACGGGDDPAPAAAPAGEGGTQEVTVGVIPIVDVAPIYLGVQEGFFTERGLDVTLETAQGGAAVVPAVVSGQYEFGFSNITSLLVATSQGLPLRAVSNGVASTGEQDADFGGVVVAADSEIQSAADLAGRRVAVNTLNNIGDTTVRASVREAGGDPEAVQFVELPFPDMPAALQQGNVDAVWVVEPFLTAARSAGGRVVASNYVDAADDLTVAVYFTSQQYAQQNPDVVERFAAAMEESLQYAQDNPDAARQVLSTYTQIAPEVVEQLQLPAWPTEVNRESVETLVELAQQDGLIEQAPDLDQVLP